MSKINGQVNERVSATPRIVFMKCECGRVIREVANSLRTYCPNCGKTLGSSNTIDEPLYECTVCRTLKEKSKNPKFCGRCGNELDTTLVLNAS